jgi:acyl-CoA thioesterase FadM
MTTVCTDIASLKSKPIPAAWRAKLAELLEAPASAQDQGAQTR